MLHSLFYVLSSFLSLIRVVLSKETMLGSPRFCWSLRFTSCRSCASLRRMYRFQSRRARCQQTFAFLDYILLRTTGTDAYHNIVHVSKVVKDELPLSDYSELVSYQFHPRPVIHNFYKLRQRSDQVPFVDSAPILSSARKNGIHSMNEMRGERFGRFSFEAFDERLLRAMSAKVEEDDEGQSLLLC